ncbi:MAG: glycosyltransferase family 2 protein [Nitrospira sp.]|nr:glycosyltransferase family 2 protein [Nitrospira sp.]
MINGKKVVVVMPAYNAAKTLRQTFAEIPMDVVDDVILVDDASQDQTVSVAREIGIKTFVHRQNRGYGGNQKTCYRQALGLGADVVVMLHPDYQYTPKLILAMSAMIAFGVYEVVLGSRVLGKGALAGGMPLYKYVANRFLTLVQNLFLGRKLSEYHTGYRAFSSKVLLTLPLEENSDDFAFDNEMLVQLVYYGYEIAEITCPTKYFPDASSISFRRSVKYGLSVLMTTAKFVLAKWGIRRFPIFDPQGRTLADPAERKEGGSVVLVEHRR